MDVSQEDLKPQIADEDFEEIIYEEEEEEDSNGEGEEEEEEEDSSDENWKNIRCQKKMFDLLSIIKENCNDQI